ncbi:hypothetical protein COU56_03535 [Candidatus Pacearchaeota archaeon CG10_big_fil_rev_8_21_14_0_10_31_9]|nr:MAG: hypothetical protein AUJ62_02215 [Candidatus Pacearchaeota archaeon CG1_02_32_21]PIN93605.1 MAG: hypothetical protein COU56_03535 [Candidatus Pacearchaeota archaeon CG10_big_fil_rev_8_21_14_0_10_31_9]PIZ82946.1 MAG: hypothetical protein COX97_02200 [Candidatus Pacearchaeota archaeon CG_4_10_14_0_2_um_filter_05_32_18]
MDLKKFYYIQGIFYTILGFLLLTNIKSNILGAVVGAKEITTSISLFFGIFFLIGGISLVIITRR